LFVAHHKIQFFQSDAAVLFILVINDLRLVVGIPENMPGDRD
jgi:hypothetical protein